MARAFHRFKLFIFLCLDFESKKVRKGKENRKKKRVKLKDDKIFWGGWIRSSMIQKKKSSYEG